MSDSGTATPTDKPRIVFFGSGPVAARSLELLSNHCDIEAVVTKPQPPHHKDPFPVLAVAEQHGYKVFTPYGKKELSDLFATRPVTSTLGVVIDYGFIINQDVIDYFPFGIINSHFSLLPEWRGADPITFSILSGQQQTGVSLMLITAGMDEGPLLGFGVQPLSGTETTPELTDRLILLSDGLLKEELPRYLQGAAKLTDQLEVHKDHDNYPAEPTYSRKLTKDDSILDFTKPAEQLEREIRAYAEWPKSRTNIGGKAVIITRSHVAEADSASGTASRAATSVDPSATGTIWLDDTVKPKYFGFMTNHGILVVDALKPAGKPEMTAEAFIAGYGHLLRA
jgi:methionyl-tRNA formyltransferase